MRYHRGRNVFSGVNLMKKSLSLELPMEECKDVGAGGGSCCAGGGGGIVLSILTGGVRLKSYGVHRWQWLIGG